MEAVPGSPGASLVERAKAIILKPKDEWPKIAAEQQSQGDILRKYVLPLAAIGPVASFLGGQIFGYGGFGISFRPSLMGSVTTAILSYLLTIVGVFVLAWIADFLAPKFAGQSNRLNAFKLVAYGATAAWLAGIFGLIPALAVFGLLGLYSFYLFYTGSGPLMAIPDDKRIAYTVVTFLAAAVLYWIVALLVGLIIGIVGLGTGAISSVTGSSDKDEVTVNIPGVGSINTGDLEKQAERMEKIQSGELKPVATETLKTLLPDRIGAFERTGVSTQALGSAGAAAEGTYKAAGDASSGDYQFDLRVQDMLALSGLAGIGAAMGIEQTREDETGYERTGTVDGQWREEKWNNTSNRGTYAVLVAKRFRVEASGNAPDIGVLKQAVASVSESSLTKLADE